MSLVCLAALTGCPSDDTTPSDDEVGDTESGTTDGTETGTDTGTEAETTADTGTETDTDTETSTTGGEECTELPANPGGETCVAEGTAGGSVLIRGDILGPGLVYEGGSVLIENGVIQCVGCDCGADADAVITCPDAVVSPGLINTHDHISFANNWPIGEGEARYYHRHDWREGINGFQSLPYNGGASTEEVVGAELRFVMGGATSTASAGGRAGLLRNVDSAQDLEGLPIQPVDTDTFPLNDASGIQRLDDCNYGNSPTTANDIEGESAYLPHIAEGIDEYAQNEFSCTSQGQLDVIEPQTAIVHAVGVSADDVQAIVDAKAKVVWSPRSNVVLYGQTAPATLMDTLGVPLALGTDWIPSGSMNMLRELACADLLNTDHYGGHFSDEELWRMVTTNGAFAIGGQDGVGMLKQGYAADIAIFAKNGNAAHRAVVESHEQYVALVMRGGTPLYGDAELLASPALGGDACEALDVCGVPKAACVSEDTSTTLSAVQNDVTYPLFFCGTPDDEPTCNPSRPEEFPNGLADDDQDGDGIIDADDNCPSVFNPVFTSPMHPYFDEQPDADGDDLGDVCDPCPFTSGDGCTNDDANDIDGDGVQNGDDNCPLIANPGQEDADADGHGDVCDACADPNPGLLACSASIEAIQNPDHPDHIPAGSTVLVTGLTVTALFGNDNGFYAETGTGEPWTGIVGYTNGNPMGLDIGDTVDLSGTIEEYFGLTEIVGTAVITADTQTPGELAFSPKVMAPADIATGGSQAEAHEGMLVKVDDVAITVENLDDPDDFDQFIVTDGLVVDDNVFLDIDNLCPVGSTFASITGVLHFSFENFKIEPRFAEDFEQAQCTPY